MYMQSEFDAIKLNCDVSSISVVRSFMVAFVVNLFGKINLVHEHHFRVHEKSVHEYFFFFIIVFMYFATILRPKNNEQYLNNGDSIDKRS